MLASELNLPQGDRVEKSARYIRHWIEAMKGDSWERRQNSVNSRHESVSLSCVMCFSFHLLLGMHSVRIPECIAREDGKTLPGTTRCVENRRRFLWFFWDFCGSLSN